MNFKTFLLSCFSTAICVGASAASISFFGPRTELSSRDRITDISRGGGLVVGDWDFLATNQVWPDDLDNYEVSRLAVNGLARVRRIQAVTPDGTSVLGLGLASSGSLVEYFIYELGGERTTIDVPGRADVYELSDDGKVAIGSTFHDGERRAFRWDLTSGARLLGDISVFPESVGLAISGDGSTIVGAAGPDLLSARAMTWTETHGMRLLGLPDLEIQRSAATVVSADGSIIAGEARTAGEADRLPVRWINGEVEFLERYAAEGDTWVSAMSADGRTIVGNFNGFGELADKGVLWDERGEVFEIRELLEEAGVEIPEEWELFNITAISPDGRYVAGRGNMNAVIGQDFDGLIFSDPGPWIADLYGTPFYPPIPEPSTSMLVGAGAVVFLFIRPRRVSAYQRFPF